MQTLHAQSLDALRYCILFALCVALYSTVMWALTVHPPLDYSLRLLMPAPPPPLTARIISSLSNPQPRATSPGLWDVFPSWKFFPTPP